MVFGAGTYRAIAHLMSTEVGPEVFDPWVTRMRELPATVISGSPDELLDGPDATLATSDAVDVVARLKDASSVPLRSHGSLSLNRSLLAAGLVDRIQVTLFPVICGRTGVDPILRHTGDADLELLEQHTLDDHTQELLYHPAPRH